ncbi:MAG: hypothetical protein ACHQF4_10640 [Sphingobacteriales bacterium]
MKVYLIVGQMLLLTSCKVLAQHELKLPLTYNNRNVVYSLFIPQKYKLVKQKVQNAEVQEVQVAAHLRDSSVIYITDDLQGGGGNVAYKIEKYGTSYELHNYILNDTAALDGIHNGKYWKERKYYNVVVGYYNVGAEKKAQYDNIIDTIIPQVDKVRKKMSLSKIATQLR